MGSVGGIDIGHSHEHVDIGKVGLDPHVGMDAPNHPAAARTRREHDHVATPFDRALIVGPAGAVWAQARDTADQVVGSAERRARVRRIGRERYRPRRRSGIAGLESISRREVEGILVPRRRPCIVGRPRGILIDDVDPHGGKVVPSGPLVVEHGVLPRGVVCRGWIVRIGRRQKLELADRPVPDAVAPRADHELLFSKRAATAIGLQPRERVKRALTEHVEPAAALNAGDMCQPRVVSGDKIVAPCQADVLFPRGRRALFVLDQVGNVAMQDTAVEYPVVEDVAGREIRLDADQRRGSAGCREVVHDSGSAPPQHRDTPVAPWLSSEPHEEGLAVHAVSVKWGLLEGDRGGILCCQGFLDEQVVIRAGRPDVSRRGTTPGSAHDEHRLCRKRERRVKVGPNLGSVRSVRDETEECGRRAGRRVARSIQEEATPRRPLRIAQDSYLIAGI
jgi:hypothetical protein